MSASIDTNTTPFGARGASTDASSARPQVQSRRVSLKVGPFGLTYATDELLWPKAEQNAAAVDAGQSDAQQSASQQAASQQAAAQQSAHSFSRELHEAWRRQVEARAEKVQGYGPDARRTDAADASASQSADASASASSGATRPTAKPSAMRRAINAYLAQAGEFSQAAPMLTAVA